MTKTRTNGITNERYEFETFVYYAIAAVVNTALGGLLWGMVFVATIFTVESYKNMVKYQNMSDEDFDRIAAKYE